MKKKPPEVDQLSAEIQQVFDALNEQPDLACVIAGAAFLDAGLESILRAHFRSHRIGNNLLRPDGPLGSFAARADLAYCLGLASKDHYEDLRRIAEIRNAFAHNHLQLTFGDARVQEMCSNLREWRTIGWNDAAEDSGPTVRRIAARNKFALSAALISQRLLLTALGENRRNVER